MLEKRSLTCRLKIINNFILPFPLHFEHISFLFLLFYFPFLSFFNLTKPK